MNASEFVGLIGGALAFLLTPLLGLVAWTFTTFRTEAMRSIEQLRAENRDQAIKMASLEQAASLERIVQALEKIGVSQSETARVLDRVSIVVERLDRKLGTSAGEYPAVRGAR